MGKQFQWSRTPYKGLSYYGPNDVPLFAGREESVRRCARQLAERNTRLLILQGPTGCGKSSFLRAGLIPFLERQHGRFEFARSPDATDSEALFVRSTDSPLKALAAELYKFVSTAKIKTQDGTEKLDAEAVLLGCEDPVTFVEKAGNSGEQLIQALNALAAEWPRSLALIIDQGEEVLTLKSGKDDPAAEESRDQFFDFVYRFNRTDFDLKLILAIRTEYYGKFVARMGRSTRDLSRIEVFYLNELTESEIVEAIERPTSKSDYPPYGTPFDHYRFEFEEGLPDLIAFDVMSNKNIKGGILPVIQIVCENLYRDAKAKAPPGAAFQITKDDYAQLPTLDVQLEGYLALKLEEFGRVEGINVTDFEVNAWKDVLSGLSIAQIDGTVVKQLKDKEELRTLAKKSGCRLPFESTMTYLSDPSVRILSGEEVVNSVTNKPVYAYSLGHDALGLVMENWKTTQKALDRRVVVLSRVYLIMGGSAVVLGLVKLTFDGFRFSETTRLMIVNGTLFAAFALLPIRYLRRWLGSRHASRALNRARTNLSRR